MSQPLKKVGQYRFIRKIGKGATSEVFEARKQGSTEKYAVKMIKLKGLNEQQKQMITKEVNIIKSIEHPNIVHLYETFQTTNNYYLAFELCEQGDLEKYLMEYCGPRIPEETAQRIIFCIADAVSLIHSKGIAHRDIKLANILLKKNCQIKLADFGFAKSFDENILMQTYCGTPITMAPEILLSQPYNNKCDIWSLGVIVFHLIYGRLPFSISDGITRFIQYVTKNSLQIPSQPPMPIEFKELLVYSLEKNPNKRFDINAFLANKWVQGGNISSSSEGLTKRIQSVEEMLRNISHEYRKTNHIQKVSTSDSSEVELIIAQRVHKTLTSQIDKILSRHVKLRTSLQERVKDEIALLNLLEYLDYKYLEYIWELPLKIGKQTASQTIKSKELQKLQFPKPLNNIKPESEPAGNILLSFLEQKAQSTTDLQQKIKEYQLVIDLLEMSQRFEIRVIIMFADHLYEDIEVDNVIENIKSRRINDEVSQQIEFTKGNFITIAIQCNDKDEKVKNIRETFVSNCKKRINEIQREISGY